MGSENNKRNGGTPGRMGKRFHEEVEIIKDEKRKNGTSKTRIATEKITNLIIRHKNWSEIRSHIIESSQEEVNQYGL